VASLRRGQQGSEHRDLSERDLQLLELMLQENTAWHVTIHNGHVTALQRIGPALQVQDIPTWWLRYFAANGIDIET